MVHISEDESSDSDGDLANPIARITLGAPIFPSDPLPDNPIRARLIQMQDSRKQRRESNWNSFRYESEKDMLKLHGRITEFLILVESIFRMQ